MGKIKVAFRQLYLARGCNLADEQELSYTLEIDGYSVELYMGRKPKLYIVSQSKKIIPFDPTQNTPFPLGTLSIQPVEKTEFSGGFFTDFFCVREIEVPDASIGKFQAEGAESQVGKIEIIDYARKNHGEGFRAVANFMSGFVGLRYHFQFVFEPINEIYWVWSVKDNAWSVDSIHSPVMQILEGITLNDAGKEGILNLKFVPNASVEQIRAAALSMELLKKAWQEQISDYKFINLFTALEIAIKAVVSRKRDEQIETIDKLKNLISIAANEADRPKLIQYVEQSPNRSKSLGVMFEELAKEANFESHDNDVEAFKIFNVRRNQLIHGGTFTDSMTAALKSGSHILFQDLVERYVNWAFFRDDNYYRTRFRKHVSIKKDSLVHN